MKKKEIQTIMTKKAGELETLIDKKRVSIANAYLKRSEEKNTNMIKNMKKELAIMLTALREQQIIDLIAQKKENAS